LELETQRKNEKERYFDDRTGGRSQIKRKHGPPVNIKYSLQASVFSKMVKRLNLDYQCNFRKKILKKEL
jgi:hypothetical protein